MFVITVDIGSQDTKGARANGGKNSAEDNILEFSNLNFSRKVHTLTRARERGFPCSDQAGQSNYNNLQHWLYHKERLWALSLFKPS